VIGIVTIDRGRDGDMGRDGDWGRRRGAWGKGGRGRDGRDKGGDGRDKGGDDGEGLIGTRVGTGVRFVRCVFI
jgi:hypothetical protein